jgi:hypothetical protein
MLDLLLMADPIVSVQDLKQQKFTIDAEPTELVCLPLESFGVGGDFQGRDRLTGGT